MNVAYYTSTKSWLKNQMFDLNAKCNQNDVLVRYVALKKYLADKNIALNTYDMYGSFREIDAWWFVDPKPKIFRFLLKNRIHPKKTMMNLHEPAVVNPWGWKYLRYYSWMLKSVLTWQSELCNQNEKYSHYHFPIEFDGDKYPHYRSQRKKNLCLLMHSNKMSQVPGELYTLRREIIKYFESRKDQLLDLYGHRWNEENYKHPFFTTLFKGTTPDKEETYSEYHFVFCIDNCIVPGYITYDPIVSMATGSVPIYIPMPDSAEFIPENTFINYNDFKNLDELVTYLQSIVGTDEYEEYRNNGWAFLNSERYYPFTVKKYCEDIYNALKKMESAVSFKQRLSVQ